MHANLLYQMHIQCDQRKIRKKIEIRIWTPEQRDTLMNLRKQLTWKNIGLSLDKKGIHA